MEKRTAIIIGAGPAGLTSAYELLERTDITPIIYEMSYVAGGIAKTICHNGNRIDIGGHRFFSKSDRVMDWWFKILPLQKMSEGGQEITYQGKKRVVSASVPGPDPAHEDRVMLVRRRRSRIYFLRKFFDYPLSLNADTVVKLGFLRVLRIALSYAKSVLFPIRNEQNLEHFFINRFGEELYRTFFKSYTEKVWGARCSEISAEWGRQRIKGLSIGKAITHFVRKATQKRRDGVSQKKEETSLIEQFLYPKYGPGQMWQEVARIVMKRGGEIHFGHRVCAIEAEGAKVRAITVKNEKTGECVTKSGDYFFSTMPVKELIASLDLEIPEEVRRVADGLMYRDFITVGLLVEKLKIENCLDNWLYIQEPDVRLGRVQIFNNWSPYMVEDPRKAWIGLEYFCSEGDSMCRKSDREFADFAIEELDRIKLIDKKDVRDNIVIRMPKAYPAYFGTYNEFSVIRNFIDRFENLFLIGRNGMHRYNNQDHSMLTAMTAVDNIQKGITSKDNIWAVNTEEEYHEKTNT